MLLLNTQESDWRQEPNYLYTLREIKVTLCNVKTIWSNIYSYGIKYNTNLQAHGSNLLCSRVEINSTESLFGANVSLDVSKFELKKYCDCSTEIQQNENSISNHYTANCSITTQVVQCSSKTTSQKLISTCTTYQNRFKRDANMDSVGLIDRSEDSDDVIESQPLHYDPNFDPNPVFVNTY